MVEVTNVPLRGDAIWIDFNPQFGHEQAGRRPAVKSKRVYPCRPDSDYGLESKKSRIHLFLTNRDSRCCFRKNRSSLKNTVGHHNEYCEQKSKNPQET